MTTSKLSWFWQLKPDEVAFYFRQIEHGMHRVYTGFSQYAHYSENDSRPVTFNLFKLFSNAFTEIGEDKWMSLTMSFMFAKLSLAHFVVPLKSFPTLFYESCCFYNISTLIKEGKDLNAFQNELKTMSDFFQTNYKVTEFPGNDTWVEHLVEETSIFFSIFLDFFKVSFDARVKVCIEFRKFENEYNSLKMQLKTLVEKNVPFRERDNIKKYRPKSKLTGCTVWINQLLAEYGDNQQEKSPDDYYSYKFLKTRQDPLRPNILIATCWISLLNLQMHSAKHRHELMEKLIKGSQPVIRERQVTLEYNKNDVFSMNDNLKDAMSLPSATFRKNETKQVANVSESTNESRIGNCVEDEVVVLESTPLNNNGMTPVMETGMFVPGHIPLFNPITQSYVQIPFGHPSQSTESENPVYPNSNQSQYPTPFGIGTMTYPSNVHNHQSPCPMTPHYFPQNIPNDHAPISGNHRPTTPDSLPDISDPSQNHATNSYGIFSSSFAQYQTYLNSTNAFRLGIPAGGMVRQMEDHTRNLAPNRFPQMDASQNLLPSTIFNLDTRAELPAQPGHNPSINYPNT